MKIHHEGFTWITGSFILLAISLSLFTVPAVPVWISAVASALTFLLFVIILQFFRLPKRIYKAKPGELVSPCDGKVVVIEKVKEPEYFKDERIQVSIFMSPVNVHANWYPAPGVVAYTKYHPGKYLVAWHPKSSELNERSTIVLQTEGGKYILFRQVAGILARKIKTYAKTGIRVKGGTQAGFIKFGSRVDIFLPLGTDIQVKIGDKVTGNISVIAKL